jgi:hypothetical protein
MDGIERLSTGSSQENVASLHFSIAHFLERILSTQTLIQGNCGSRGAERFS